MPASRVRPFAAVLIAAALAACAGRVALPGTESMAQIEATRLSASGTIVALDTTRRLVTLRDDGGQALQVHADASVRGFERLRVGDVVTLDYLLAVAADIRPGGSLPPGAYLQEASEAPRHAGRPGARIAERVTVVAPILAVDPAANTLTIEAPGARPVTLAVESPEHRAALPGLRVGDLLRVAFTEAVAVDIRPRGR